MSTIKLFRLAPIAMFLPALALAHSTGADPGVSGAPGDIDCTACHGGSPNTGGGSVKLSFANGPVYTPGQTQLVTVTITDSTARRWGFEVSPRIASSAATKGAGTLASVDSNTQILNDAALSWITHTAAGTRNGTTGSITFTFNWTAPATAVGDVGFYVAANAANGNGQPTGDKIYTSNVTLTPAATTGGDKPVISANGVVNGASFQNGITAGSWITIQGTNLATKTRTWDSNTEIINGVLPTSLDGTKVTVNGKQAAVYFISPTQLNVQAPDDGSQGNVDVVVSTAAGNSDPVQALLQPASPALFMFDPQGRKYPAAVAADGSFLGPDSLFGTALKTRPAKGGETILLFGTGFGATNPAVPSGKVFASAAPLAGTVRITIGGVDAQVLFAGLTGAGLYQFNVVVPTTAGTGDQPLVATIGGLQTQPASLSIQ